MSPELTLDYYFIYDTCRSINGVFEYNHMCSENVDSEPLLKTHSTIMCSGSVDSEPLWKHTEYNHVF